MIFILAVQSVCEFAACPHWYTQPMLLLWWWWWVVEGGLPSLPVACGRVTMSVAAAAAATTTGWFCSRSPESTQTPKPKM